MTNPPSHTPPSFVIETTPDVQGRHANLFWNIEASCVVVFTVEFGSRLLCCPSVGAFAVDKLNWIDFASIVPCAAGIAAASHAAHVHAHAASGLRVTRIPPRFLFFRVSCFG